MSLHNLRLLGNNDINKSVCHCVILFWMSVHWIGYLLFVRTSSMKEIQRSEELFCATHHIMRCSQLSYVNLGWGRYMYVCVSYRRLVRHISSVCLRIPICALSTQSVWRSCQRTSSWLVESAVNALKQPPVTTQTNRLFSEPSTYSRRRQFTVCLKSCN